MRRQFRIQGEGTHYSQDVDHRFKKFGNKEKQRGRVAEAFRKDMNLVGENWA